MGSLSIWHWLIVGAVFLLLFGGRGKISELMGDFAQGIKAFKKGMSDDQTAATPTGADGVKTINHDDSAAAVKARSDEKQSSAA